MNQLSTYFTFEELTHSQIASRRGLVNIPTTAQYDNLKQTAERMDHVRRLLSAPVIVSSGFRSEAVNRAVGGSTNSSHTSGEAVDFTCPGYGDPRRIFDRIRLSGIKFDQLILEFNHWVHIGFGERMRGQCLIYDGRSYKEVAK